MTVNLGMCWTFGYAQRVALTLYWSLTQGCQGQWLPHWLHHTCINVTQFVQSSPINGHLLVPWSKVICWLTNVVFAFALLFITGLIISLILFRNLQNVMETQWTLITCTFTLSEWLTNVTELVNITSVLVHCWSMVSEWLLGYIYRLWIKCIGAVPSQTEDQFLWYSMRQQRRYTTLLQKLLPGEVQSVTIPESHLLTWMLWQAVLRMLSTLRSEGSFYTVKQRNWLWSWMYCGL